MSNQAVVEDAFDMGIWIARNHPQNGMLGLYHGKPVRTKYCWEPTGDMRILDPQWFPEVTWENSPKELVIKEDE